MGIITSVHVGEEKCETSTLRDIGAKHCFIVLKRQRLNFGRKS